MENRVIKFRSYCSRGKIMHTPCEVYADIEGELYTRSWYTDEELGTRNYIHKNIMQFTGTYDRQKTPIYEGDILLQQMEPLEDGIGVVKWNQDDAGFVIDYGEEEGLLSHEMNTFTVIGNIFQDKHLLE